ncbi:hypothetical protein [Tunicatimonas pelagia]|uniref:hypothetical protein n=1 Tax=Tunicatimonas pelagia TaxID=931531 RepID=UPI00266537A6|nr:hypothetical protein [Tunicatimonas pelagia]WKN45080.1 hypothetical protein P0M28_08895 [Tunicatimonas pelagia]
MSQDYDKILKENIEALILPLADKLLGLSLGRLEEIPDDIQTTLERRPDFLKRVISSNSHESYILHLEFQVKDKAAMLNRMLLYYAMLKEKYGESIKQYVVFMGRRKPRMSTQLKEGMIDYRFSLVDIHQLDYRKLLDDATQPEQAVLAILSNFKKSEVDTILPEILRKLQALTNNERKLRRYVRQLEILSNLRDLQKETIKHTEAMPITYNIEDDIRYQQGIKYRKRQRRKYRGNY